MILQGKGFFITNLSKCEDGEPNSILAAARSAGLSHVIIKIADGEQVFGMDASGNDMVAPFVQMFKSAGIKVWGWHSVYGDNPEAEAATAAARAHALGLDGYVVCAGDEYTRSGLTGAARQFMQSIRSTLGIPIALSSYRFPNFHPEFPWSTFLEFCDVHMPQVAWEQAHDAGAQLRESKRQCDALPNSKPYIPTGTAYGIPGWSPSAEEIIDFLNTAVALDLPAINFHAWDECRKDLPLVWTAIAEFVWPENVQASQPAPVLLNTQAAPGIPDDFLAQFLEALNCREAARMSALYEPNATQVWGDQILNGAAAIQSGYDAFFDRLPAGTFCIITKANATEDGRLFTWEAGSLSGETTLVLKNGKIILDYTFIFERS